MILKCTSFDQMNKEIIGQDMSIVIFGAGVIGTITVPEVLGQYGLLNRVLFYVDNSCKEQGQKINIGNRVVEIEPVDRLHHAGGNTVIIIAVSRYVEVLEQLGGMPCTNHMLCYIIAMICIDNF